MRRPTDCCKPWPTQPMPALAGTLSAAMTAVAGVIQKMTETARPTVCPLSKVWPLAPRRRACGWMSAVSGCWGRCNTCFLKSDRKSLLGIRCFELKAGNKQFSGCLQYELSVKRYRTGIGKQWSPIGCATSESDDISNFGFDRSVQRTSSSHQLFVPYSAHVLTGPGQAWPRHHPLSWAWKGGCKSE